MLIVIEGIDGTGKSTQVKRLSETIKELGKEVVLSREPTNGTWGKLLRNSLESGRLSPEEEIELFIKDRKEHVDELILPALQQKKVVLLDRYYFSMMAYQGARGFDPQKIRADNEAFAPRPDLLFIFDLDVDTALERICARGDIANEFEQKSNLLRCREIFLSLANEAFVRVIDASDTEENIHKELIGKLMEMI